MFCLNNHQNPQKQVNFGLKFSAEYEDYEENEDNSRIHANIEKWLAWHERLGVMFSMYPSFGALDAQ